MADGESDGPGTNHTREKYFKKDIFVIILSYFIIVFIHLLLGGVK